MITIDNESTINTYTYQFEIFISQAIQDQEKKTATLAKFIELTVTINLN